MAVRQSRSTCRNRRQASKGMQEKAQIMRPQFILHTRAAANTLGRGCTLGIVRCLLFANTLVGIVVAKSPSLTMSAVSSTFRAHSGMHSEKSAISRAEPIKTQVSAYRLLACALRSGRFAPEPPGTAVDARLDHQAHGHRQAQIERRDMDKQYCPRPICLQKAAH